MASWRKGTPARMTGWEVAAKTRRDEQREGKDRAEGRVERGLGTARDRLVKGMRGAGVRAGKRRDGSRAAIWLVFPFHHRHEAHSEHGTPADLPITPLVHHD